MANVKWYGAKVYADILNAMDKVNNKVALDVRNEAVQSMRGPKSGRTYKLSAITRTGKAYADMGLKVGGYTSKGKAKYIVGYKIHRASAAGEAPAIPHGTLRDSIQVEFISKMHRRVGTNIKYGKHLELGTRKMAARPYLRPALDRAVSKVGGHIQDERL